MTSDLFYFLLLIFCLHFYCVLIDVCKAQKCILWRKEVCERGMGGLNNLRLQGELKFTICHRGNLTHSLSEAKSHANFDDSRLVVVPFYQHDSVTPLSLQTVKDIKKEWDYIFVILKKLISAIKDQSVMAPAPFAASIKLLNEPKWNNWLRKHLSFISRNKNSKARLFYET